MPTHLILGSLRRVTDAGIGALVVEHGLRMRAMPRGAAAGAPVSGPCNRTLAQRYAYDTVSQALRLGACGTLKGRALAVSYSAQRSLHRQFTEVIWHARGCWMRW